jgi:hypothetical protein
MKRRKSLIGAVAYIPTTLNELKMIVKKRWTMPIFSDKEF